RSLTIFFSMIESHMVLLMYMAYVVYAARAGVRRFQEPRTAFCAGLIMGLAFLARIDSFMLPVVYGAFLVSGVLRGVHPRRQAMRCALAAMGGVMLFAVPFLASNWIRFGHLATVSAWMKARPPSLDAFRVIGDWLFLQFLPRVQQVLGLGAGTRGFLAAALLAGVA